MTSATTSLSRPERHLQVFMGACALVYLVGGLGFLALNDHLLAGINSIGAALGLGSAPMGDRFWLALAGSMMLTITTCCWLVARDPRRHLAACLPVVVSKATSTAAGLVFFFAGDRVFAPLLVALTDFPLCVATWWLYRRARGATPASSEGS